MDALKTDDDRRHIVPKTRLNSLPKTQHGEGLHLSRNVRAVCVRAVSKLKMTISHWFKKFMARIQLDQWIVNDDVMRRLFRRRICISRLSCGIHRCRQTHLHVLLIVNLTGVTDYRKNVWLTIKRSWIRIRLISKFYKNFDNIIDFIKFQKPFLYYRFCLSHRRTCLCCLC